MCLKGSLQEDRVKLELGFVDINVVINDGMQSSTTSQLDLSMWSYIHLSPSTLTLESSFVIDWSCLDRGIFLIIISYHNFSKLNIIIKRFLMRNLVSNAWSSNSLAHHVFLKWKCIRKSVAELAVEHITWGKSRCELLCRFPHTGGLHRTSGDAPLDTLFSMLIFFWSIKVWQRIQQPFSPGMPNPCNKSVGKMNSHMLHPPPKNKTKPWCQQWVPAVIRFWVFFFFS